VAPFSRQLDGMTSASLSILESARTRNLEKLGIEPKAVANAVREFATVGDAASAIELVGRAWRIWLSHSELNEGSATVAAALAVPRESPIPIWEARALYAVGLFAFRSRDQARSRTSNEQALLIARQTGDVRGECDALTGLARVALRDGTYDQVVALAGQARERATVAGDDAAGAAPLHLQAAGVRLQGNYQAAHELYLQSLGRNRARGDMGWVSMELHNLGWVEVHLGNIEEARARFTERDVTTVKNAFDDAWADLNWAAIAIAEGDAAEAQRRFGLGICALEKLAVTLDPDDLSELEWLKGRIKADG
jgi:tetratricopeptide (TPR) repeat protein